MLPRWCDEWSCCSGSNKDSGQLGEGLAAISKHYIFPNLLYNCIR
nr:MAG TPA: hypothetical protein [Caudoviricetes sp.]